MKNLSAGDISSGSFLRSCNLESDVTKTGLSWNSDAKHDTIAYLRLCNQIWHILHILRNCLLPLNGLSFMFVSFWPLRWVCNWLQFCG